MDPECFGRRHPPPMEKQKRRTKTVALVDLHSGKGKGRAANGDRPIGAGRRREPQIQSDVPPPHPPPPRERPLVMPPPLHATEAEPKGFVMPDKFFGVADGSGPAQGVWGAPREHSAYRWGGGGVQHDPAMVTSAAQGLPCSAGGCGGGAPLVPAAHGGRARLRRRFDVLWGLWGTPCPRFKGRWIAWAPGGGRCSGWAFWNAMRHHGRSGGRLRRADNRRTP